ncbi:MAG: hypothetical protein OXN81_06300 [Alphaproteobacteria bacterium]|nr:hypothetical protein [Alphaproteobacteria bacterium]
MKQAKSRCLYPTPAEWSRIQARAKAAGMKVSPFLVACALKRDAAPRAGQPLVLTAEEQREMHERVARLDLCSRALLEPLPGVDMSALEAAALLCRLLAPEDAGEAA